MMGGGVFLNIMFLEQGKFQLNFLPDVLDLNTQGSSLHPPPMEIFCCMSHHLQSGVICLGLHGEIGLKHRN